MPEVSLYRLNEIYSKAKILRNKYSDKIPDHIVTGTLRYKVQKNWFNAISLLLMRAARRGELDDDFMKKYKEFSKYLSRLQDEQASKEDVERGNKILDDLIEYCRSTMNKITKEQKAA